jgi:hypothetical protein
MPSIRRPSLTKSLKASGAAAPEVDKWVTFLGSPYVAAGNVVLSIASVATYSVARGSTITAGHSVYNFLWLAIYSAIVFFAKTVTQLQQRPIVVMFFEILLAYNIIWYLTMGWSDKEAAEKANVADNLKTEADKTRCLSGTGTCAESKKCIKEVGSTVTDNIRKGEIVSCT